MPENVPQNSFKKGSQEIVKYFLQTVMVVDDKAYYPNEDAGEDPNSETPPSKLIPPSRLTFGAEKSEAVKERQTGEEKSAPGDKEHKLNAKMLTDGFAKMGIACTVIQPKSAGEKDLKLKVQQLARKCDVVVFDWVLPKESEPGKTVSDFVVGITEHSTGEARRMRLIAIYTGNSDLEEVFGRLENALKEKDLLSRSDRAKLTLEYESVRIFILAKQYADIPDGSPLVEFQIEEDKMPEKLVAEFTEMTFGLVPNVALQAFAVIRDNTHQVLAKFHPGLDAPFATHRFMLPHPADANEFLTTLIGSEITALLEGKRVGDVSDKANFNNNEYNFLQEWVNDLLPENSELPDRWKKLSENIDINRQNGRQIVYELLTEDTSPEKRIRKKLSGLSDEEMDELTGELAVSLHKRNITGNFLSDESETGKSDMEFAYRTSVASFYKDKPFLRFGSILKLAATNPHKFYLCVQPPCDCVRISNKRKFPLLPLKVVTDDDKRFDLIIFDGHYLRVEIGYRPYDSLSDEFKSNNKTKLVESARDENDNFVFSTTGDAPRKYVWLGELKFAHAQRIANEYATKFSRVGLDESEWLRRFGAKIDR